MHSIQTLGKTFTAPSDWSEVTRDQILFLIRLMNSGKDYDEVMFRLIVEFFQLPTTRLTNFKHSRPKRYREYCGDLLTLTEGLFDFLFEKISPSPNSSPLERLEEVIIAKQLTRQLLPEYNGFYGPRDNLNNVTIWEFTVAEAAFMEFIESANKKSEQTSPLGRAADKLIATLYRPPRSDVEAWRQSDQYNLDDRRIFNDQLIERDMLEVKNWDNDIKELIFLYFFSCREALPTMFPKIYKNRLKKKSDKSATWSDIILQQAKEEKKEPEQISERNLMIFLRQRELDIEDAEYQQDEMDKITNKNKNT
jgi:hypothetical protein